MASPIKRHRREQPVADPPSRPQRHDQGQDDRTVAGDEELGRLVQVGHARATVPVVSLTTPPALTALRVFQVPDGSTASEGDDPAPHHDQWPEGRPEPAGATPGPPPAPPPGGGGRTACTGRRCRRAPRWRPIVGAGPGPAAAHAEPDAHEVLGMKRLDDAVAGGRDGGQDDHQERPRPTHPPPPTPAGATRHPKTRTTHANRPSTAWDRYHRWVESWSGAHHGNSNRVTAGTRPSHHVGEPMSGRNAKTKGEAQQRVARRLGEDRCLGPRRGGRRRRGRWRAWSRRRRRPPRAHPASATIPMKVPRAAR